MKKSLQIYQFKITLNHIKPRIWRRIQVPSDLDFADFHEVIQDAMGWHNSHLHEFEILSPKHGVIHQIGSQFDDAVGSELDIIDGATVKISSYFSLNNKRAKYEYDFGDGWEHAILFERIVPIKAGVKYPICTAGERACPPENCGGFWGYASVLEALKNQDSPESKGLLEWIGEFDPEDFDPKEVIFLNAKTLE
jgi:hypothetical protein